MKPADQILKLVLVGAFMFFGATSNAQERPENSEFSEPSTAFWLGTYTNFRLSKKLFWAGETHFRTSQYNGNQYFGRMGQIYNRHGIKYLFSKKFSATLGGVLRLNFSPQPGNDDYHSIVLEPRIWHEYLFAMPFSRFMVYHRLRIEHRWSRSNLKSAPEFSYRNRFRYKFMMKIPLNNRSLVPGTIYFSPDIEIIMQNGKSVIDSPMEDLRLYPLFGYIVNPNISFSAGVAYTMGQSLNAGYQYNTRWLLRVNSYISLDFRKFEDKIPETKFFD